jgi:hypothetical protein
MHASQRYIWSTFCAWALTAAEGILAVSGVLAMFIRLDEASGAALRNLCVISFAAVFFFALMNANNAAAAAMHAASRARTNWGVFVLAVICASGYCIAGVIGVDLSWQMMTQGVVEVHLPETPFVLAAALFLAVGKALMAAVIEGRRAMDRAEAQAAEASENTRLDALRVAEMNARASNVTQLGPHRARRPAATSGAAALAVLGAFAAPQDASVAAPAPTSPQTSAFSSASIANAEAPPEGGSATPGAKSARIETRAAPRASGASAHEDASPQRSRGVRGATARGPRRANADYELRVSQALEMLQRQPRLSNRQIAKRTGLSPSSVDRLARQMQLARSCAS